jgi:hypothetical protein
MTFVRVGGRRTSNGKNKNNGKNKSWLGKCIHSHLSRDETAPKMGHPGFLAGLEETTPTANAIAKMVLVGWLQEQGDGCGVAEGGSCGGCGCSGDRDDVGFGGCGGLAAGVNTVSAAGAEGEGGRQKGKGQKPCCFAGSQPEGEAGDWE